MSLLNSVIKTKKRKPVSMLVYADPGLGKTSFAAEAPGAVYITSEENDEYDIARFPKVTTWPQFLEQLKTIRDEKHDFKTLVIDTIDTLQMVAEKEILAKDKAKSMIYAHGGFGKAYNVMAEMFLEIRDSYLVPIRNDKGMNIVLLTHAQKNKFEDPITNISYDTYSPNLHKRVAPIFEDWVSAIFFINYDLVKLQRKSDGKDIVEGLDGARVIYTEERPSHMAKNRFELPYEIPYEKTGTWTVLKEYIDMHYAGAEAAGKDETKIEEDGQARELQAQIAKLMPQMPEELQEPIKITVEKAGSKVPELTRILKKMKSNIGEK